MTEPHYNLRNIRKLITEAYNLQELRQLCYEAFRPVYEDYAEVKKSELVLQLLAYCERKSQLSQLLTLVREDAPAKYAQYKDQLRDESEAAAHADLHLELAATPPKITLGQEATWTAMLINNGAAEVQSVIIRQGRTLLEEPFDMSAGEQRQFVFTTRPQTKGRKQKKVSATGITAQGSHITVEATARVQVQATENIITSAEANSPTTTTTPSASADSLPVTLTLQQPVSLDLIHIPKGSFLMGSDVAQDEKARDNEQPQHKIHLSDYYIGKTVITNAQFAAFIKATDYNAHETWAETGIWFLSGVQYPSGDKNHPATYISWEDAIAFCEWLSRESKYTVRLPTEAEWEKAARGPEGRIYPWGNDWDYKRLNTIYNTPRSTTPVGYYSPQGDSPYGLVDMAGNVWEWCHDWFEETLYQSRAETEAQNPAGPVQGSRRVLRGGSWSGDRYVARCAFRNRFDPSGRNNAYGFRVVVEPHWLTDSS